MTDKQHLKREQQRRFFASKRAAGWTQLSVLLPPSVKDEVQMFKRFAMDRWRQSVKKMS